MADQKLHDQTLFNSIANDERIAFGDSTIPTGAKNILWSKFKEIIQALVYSFIDFTTPSNPSYLKGRLFYDNVKNALSYYNENSEVTVNLGQEVMFPVVNNSGATINNGDVITPNSTGIVLADRHIKSKSRLIAVATSTMLDGESGYATRLGQVGGLDTSMYATGQILYLGNNGAFATTPPTDGSYTIIVGVVDVVHATEGIITVDTNVSDLTVEVTDTNGFPPDQRTGTTLSAVELTRTFTISPDGAEFHFYELGDKYEKETAENVVWTDVEGEHWFYYQAGILTHKYDPSSAERQDIILKYSFIAAIYWDATNKEIIGDIQDERHGISFSPYVHLYLHLTRGAQWVSGFGLGNILAEENGSIDTHAQFSISTGMYFDEDISHVLNSDINVGDTTTVFYNLGSQLLRQDTQSGFALLNAPAGRLYYNENVAGTWQLTEVSNSDFVLYHIFGFNGQTKNTISVMGQAQYGNVSAARNGANTEISNLLGQLPFAEMIPLGTVIYQTRDTYTNSVKARVRSTDEGDDYIDWRSTELAQGSTPSSHANLTDVEIAGAGVAQGHVNEALYLEMTRMYQESYAWWSTLNIVTEDLLHDDQNRGQLFAQKTGNVYRIKMYIEDLGTNSNGVEVNFVLNGSDLLAADTALVTGWNTFATLQNTSVTENDKIQLAIRKGSGNDDIGDAQIYLEINK